MNKRNPIANRAPVLLMVLVYAVLAGLAVGWSWLRSDAILLSALPPPSVPSWIAVLAATAIAGAVVLASRAAQTRFRWARRLEAEFVAILGPLSTWEILVLACASSVAEEAFFRGAMQPQVGLVLTSIVFGILHTGPPRTYWPWTAMALCMGFVLGALAHFSGGLLAPILCHGLINAINLRAIAVKARTATQQQASVQDEP